MKQKVTDIQVSLPMVFLAVQLLQGWNLTKLVIVGTLIAGLYLRGTHHPKAKLLILIGLAVEIFTCVRGVPGFLRYGINRYYGVSFYIPHLAIQVVYILFALVTALKILKGNQEAVPKSIFKILTGIFVAGIFFDIVLHFGTDRELLSLGAIIGQVFKLVTLLLIDAVYWGKPAPVYSLYQAILMALVVALVLTILGGSGGGFSGGGSVSTNRCRSCGRSFSAGIGGDFMSIARSGMCSNCYNNFQWGQQFIGK